MFIVLQNQKGVKLRKVFVDAGGNQPDIDIIRGKISYSLSIRFSELVRKFSDEL